MTTEKELSTIKTFSTGVRIVRIKDGGEYTLINPLKSRRPHPKAPLPTWNIRLTKNHFTQSYITMSVSVYLLSCFNFYASKRNEKKNSM